MIGYRKWAVTFYDIDLEFLFSKFGLSQRAFLYVYVKVHIRKEIKAA